MMSEHKEAVTMIPAKWKLIYFPEFVTLQRGKDLTKSNFQQGNYIVAGSSGPIGYHNASFVNAPGITVGRSGSCGQAFLYNEPFWAHNTTLYVKDFKGNNVLFAYYYLHFLDLAKYKTGVSVPTLDRNSLNLIEILLPPVSEQRKIAYVLNTIQKAIEQQDKLIETTTELKKAIMQKLFTEGLNGEPQKQTEIGLVPQSWEVVELGRVCEKPQYGFTDSASKIGNAHFLRITDITSNGVNWETVPFCTCNDYEKYNLISGDIVFARIGATTGKSYLITDPPKAVYASYLIRIRCHEAILPEFLIHYFDTQKYWTQIDSTKGNNLKGGVNGSILSKLLVPVPNNKEQSYIANTLQAVDKKTKCAIAKKEILSELFKTALHALMTGERRVHEIDFKVEKEISEVN